MTNAAAILKKPLPYFKRLHSLLFMKNTGHLFLKCRPLFLQRSGKFRFRRR